MSECVCKCEQHLLHERKIVEWRGDTRILVASSRKYNPFPPLKKEREQYLWYERVATKAEGLLECWLRYLLKGQKHDERAHLRARIAYAVQAKNGKTNAKSSSTYDMSK